MRSDKQLPILLFCFILSAFFMYTVMHMKTIHINSGSVVSINDREVGAVKKRLPLFHENGGLVVFLHVAKTGGTTIRQEFADFPNVTVRRVFGKDDLDEAKAKIDWFLTSTDNNMLNKKGETLLLELHGGHGEPMTIFEIHSYLQRWRAQADANNKNMFVMTMLREPVSFYVSYFNFFKRPGCDKPWCDFPTMELTEDNLLRSAIPNHQCQYLARQVNKKENAAVPVSKAECDAVFQLMQADLDWIGSTEHMQEETLPLLSHILVGSADAARKMEPKNAQKKTGALSYKSLSETARERLSIISTYDRELYSKAKATYSLDMWDDIIATP